MAYEAYGPGWLCINSANTPSTDTSWVTIAARECRFDLGQRRAFSTSPFSGAQTHDGQVQLPSEPTMQLQIHDSDLETVKELIVEGAITSATADALPMPDAVNFVTKTNLPIIAFIPLLEADDGEDAEHGIWIARAMPDQIGEITYRRIEPGQDISNPYNVGFSAVIDTDLTSPYRIAWIGDPAAFGTADGLDDWALPTLSTTFI